MYSKAGSFNYTKEIKNALLLYILSNFEDSIPQQLQPH